MLTLGSLTLDDNPFVEIGYNYNTTDNGKVIGGTKTLTLTGSIAEATTGDLLQKSNEIKNWFATTSDRMIKNVTINGQFYHFVIIQSVSINSDDWVSKISYTIVLEARMETTAVLPSNIFGLSYDDHLAGLQMTESLDAPEAANGTYFVTANGLKTIQSSVRWDVKISVTCNRSKAKTAIANAKSALEKILRTTPTRREFNGYKSWKMYLQARNISVNPAQGTLDFSCTALLFPDALTIPAFVTVEPSSNHNYTSNTHSVSVSCTATGLAAVPWTNIVNLAGSCAGIDTRYDNAKAAANNLLNTYRHINTFPGTEINPYNPNCPIALSLHGDICYRPKQTTIDQSLQDGNVTVTMDWSSDGTNCSNGLSVEVTVTDNTIDQSIVENSNFWVERPIITNLNCSRAPTKSITVSVDSRYNCIQENLSNEAYYQYNEIVGTLSNQWWEIKKNVSIGAKNVTITSDWVKGC